MAGADMIEIRFRLADGTDIGPMKYGQETTVASLKEKIVSQWPKDLVLRSDMAILGFDTTGGRITVMCPASMSMADMLVCDTSTGQPILDKENGPKTVNEIKLINAGRILENNKTLAESRLPVGELSTGVMTMHVIVRPPLPGKKSDKFTDDPVKQPGCACSIM